MAVKTTNGGGRGFDHPLQTIPARRGILRVSCGGQERRSSTTRPSCRPAKQVGSLDRLRGRLGAYPQQPGQRGRGHPGGIEGVRAIDQGHQPPPLCTRIKALSNSPPPVVQTISVIRPWADRPAERRSTRHPVGRQPVVFGGLRILGSEQFSELDDLRRRRHVPPYAPSEYCSS